jgi:hypothetical protein
LSVVVSKPDGTEWRLEKGVEKLALRSKLPGATIFDLATESLRRVKATGLLALDRLPLALPASWCVNSPADSRVLRRWALPPQRDVLLSLVEILEEPRGGPLDSESSAAIEAGVRAVAPEAFGVEAVSKVLALLVPEAVPLMPAAARTFVLGESAPQDATALVAMVNWFCGAVKEARAELARWAAAHQQVPLSAAQVLDRLLWFDSEGHRHFPNPGA